MEPALVARAKLGGPDGERMFKMYLLMLGLIMVAASLLLAWWTRADEIDDSLDLALVAARDRARRNRPSGEAPAGSRIRDWWWGNSRT